MTDTPPSPPQVTGKDVDQRQAQAKGCAIILGVLILAVAGAAYCGGAGPKPDAATPVAAPAEPEASPPPTHHWVYQEGKEYGYAAAISEDEQRAGRAASEITMYRFLGEKDGVYSIATKTPYGLVVAACANPCQVVKVTAGGEVLSRAQFDEDTIVGSALTDAFNGQMEVYSPPPRD